MFSTKQEDVIRQIPKGDDFLSEAELKALTPQKIVAATAALKPKLRAFAAQAEIDRGPSQELWNELRRSGYFYMWIPKQFSGLEADLDSVMDATLNIAEGCGSTGWLAIFGLTHNRHMVTFPDDVLEKLWGKNRFIINGGGGLPPGEAVKVEGGYCISGHWKWGTLSVQSDWLQVLAMADTPEGKKPMMALVPADKIDIIDTWHTDGMRATGTHDLACKNVFVPDEHVFFPGPRNSLGPGARFDNPIYRIPVSPLLAFTTAVPTLGVARAAIEFYRERLTSHTKRGTADAQMNKQASQIRLAAADTMLVAADYLIRGAMKQNLANVDKTGDEFIPFRNGLRAQIAYGVKLCRDAVIMATESCGTSIHYLDQPMQRCLRDIMVMSSHIIFDYDVSMEQYGRGMLGLPPSTVLT